MGKLPVDSLNSLSESVSGKGGPSTTETIGNNHRKFGKTFSQHRERLFRISRKERQSVL